MRVAAIQSAVAGQLGLPVEIMREPTPTARTDRNRYHVAHGRQLAMALAAQMTRHSQTRIGQFFGGRDRTTVRHALRQIERRSAADQGYREMVADLRQGLVDVGDNDIIPAFAATNIDA